MANSNACRLLLAGGQGTEISPRLPGNHSARCGAMNKRGDWMAGSSAREVVLKRIRSALETEGKPDGASRLASNATKRSANEVKRECEQNRAALIEQFESELTEVGGAFRQAASAQ